MAKKYDIIVHDCDLDGKMHVHKESGVMANSANELAMLYAMSDQKIEIEREYEDEESRNYGRKNRQQADGNGVNADSVVVPQNAHIETTQKPREYVEKKSPPRFFDIGGIKCKMENGKMYQKQWMRLSDAEAAEFRIISDKNNKICSIKDKHIEIMKWVLVQDECENGENGDGNGKKTELLNG